MKNKHKKVGEISLVKGVQSKANEANLSRGYAEKLFQILPSRTKTMKVGIRTWDSLKRSKRENETFDDVIKDLLNERTKSLGDENIKAIKYKRKVVFFIWSPKSGQRIGFEFEYNDAKNNKLDFVLDLEIKKVFFGKLILNPSEFFGVDNLHKHFSTLFLLIYLKSIAIALSKEFNIQFFPFKSDNIILFREDLQNIVIWKKLYYEYNLSPESFRSDIELPLKLSEEEEPSVEWKVKVKNSPSKEFMDIDE